MHLCFQISKCWSEMQPGCRRRGSRPFLKSSLHESFSMRKTFPLLHFFLLSKNEKAQVAF